MIPQKIASQPAVVTLSRSSILPIHAAPRPTKANTNTLGHGSQTPEPERATGIPKKPQNAAYLTGNFGGSGVMGTHPIPKKSPAGSTANLPTNTKKPEAVSTLLTRKTAVSAPPPKMNAKTGKVLAGQTLIGVAGQHSTTLEAHTPNLHATPGVSNVITNHPQNVPVAARPIASVKTPTVKAPVKQLGVAASKSSPSGSNATDQPAFHSTSLPTGSFATNLIYPAIAYVLGAGLLFAVVKYGKV